MNDRLRQLMKKGWRTSEFWLTILAILLMPIMDEGMEYLTAHQHEYAPWMQIAVAALVAAYNVARAIVKAAGIKALVQSGPVAPVDTADTFIPPERP